MAGPEKCANGYCEIPAGTFQMGSANGDPDEQPVKTVTMTGFQLGQTEVSVGQYRAFLARTAGTQLQAVVSGCASGSSSQSLLGTAGETMTALFNRALQIFSTNSCKEIKITQNTPGMPDFPQNKKGDNYPVVELMFDEKRAFCRAEGGDLPTAAQLHFASRYDEADIPAHQLVLWDNGFRSTEPVDAGQRKDRFGVFNLLGNVWESALDAYDAQFYARMGVKDPYNPLTNQSTQLEEFSGGSFCYNRRGARAANRDVGIPGNRGSDDGFRCARPLPQHSLMRSKKFRAGLLDFTESKSVPEGSPDRSPWFAAQGGGEPKNARLPPVARNPNEAVFGMSAMVGRIFVQTILT
ncbi:MAG: SUMF1/EgtB/PvdO family nonheme iron enzyme [bacterium]